MNAPAIEFLIIGVLSKAYTDGNATIHSVLGEGLTFSMADLELNVINQILQVVYSRKWCH